MGLANTARWGGGGVGGAGKPGQPPVGQSEGLAVSTPPPAQIQIHLHEKILIGFDLLDFLTFFFFNSAFFRSMYILYLGH